MCEFVTGKKFMKSKNFNKMIKIFQTASIKLHGEIEDALPFINEEKTENQFADI